MSPVDQRIAIAESEGFRRIGMVEGHGKLMGDLPPCRGWIEIPDYLGDLNAMHAAVATLTREQYDADEGFSYHLARVVHGQDATDVGWNFYEMQEASAAQRAEAYLRTIGKWKD